MGLRKMTAVMGAVVLAATSIGLGSTIQNAAPASAAGDIVFTPTADTYVQADRPTENFGTSVRWSTEGRADIWRNVLLRFNVQVPAGEHIVSAKLRAYSEASAAASEYVDVYGTTGSWTETGATWENAPARGTWLGKTGNFATGQWVEWDVTNWVGDGGYTNFKLESNALKWIGFKSREAQDPTLKPQLVVTTEADTVTPPPTEPPATGDGTTAAATLGWGNVVTGDEFNYTGAPDATKWNVYDSAGHAGNGLRSPAQATVNGSVFNIDGTADGTTAGMSAKFANQKYGRWESRIKASGDDEYHMVSILWPDSGNWPCDGEIDYAETTGDWNLIKFFHHYDCTNQQTFAEKAIDVTQWHNYAVDWSPSGIVGYVDGVKWFEDNDQAHMPPGPMHQTLQLDWFPDSTPDGTGNMQVDWVRVYAPAATDPTPDPTPTDPPATGGSWKFSAVGDMNPSGTTSATSDSGKNATSIKNELAAGEIDNFLALGDFQYSVGNCYNSSYPNDNYSKWEANWGPLKSKTYWMAGPNHDFEPGRNEDIGKFMNGECVSSSVSATNQTLGRYHNPLEWYAFDKGNWHVLVAPTAAWRYNVTRANAMTAEMDADLAAAKARGQHLLVMYHDPYFTSKTSSHDREYDVKPWIDVFDKNKVRVLLSGSQHNYERSCPVNKSDQCVADGMQQFQVSTGGIGLRDFTNSPSFIEKRFTGTWGHLKMQLNDDGSYTWQFVATSGNMTNSDSGSRPAP